MQFVDATNPTQDEIRVWAYSGDGEPMEDFDIAVADIENLELLLDLVGDPLCPNRHYLLNSLYCLVSHTDRSDPRLMRAVVAAETAPDAWLRTWGRRTRRVIEHPSAFSHRDWCGGTYVHQPAD